MYGKVMRTNDRFVAEPDEAAGGTGAALQLLGLNDGLAITRGFIGMKVKRRTTTLGREAATYGKPAGGGFIRVDI